MRQFVCIACKEKEFSVVENNDVKLFIFECSSCLERHVVVIQEEEESDDKKTLMEPLIF